jgi:acyl dehydratase
VVTHVVTARNPARTSENRIHDDEVAERHGFRGGLVPGVTVYGYACAPVVESLGPEFLTGGYAELRFVHPVYDGDRIATDFDPAGTLTISVGAARCAVGRAATGRVIDEIRVDRADLPRERPPASSEVFAPGRVLGTFELSTDESMLSAYLDSLDGASDIYRERGWVHPGLILSCANWVLSTNAVMPAWIHTGSEVQHVRPLPVGEPLETRAVVTEEFERKGRRCVSVAVEWLDSTGPVAWGHHHAIWSLG